MIAWQNQFYVSDSTLNLHSLQANWEMIVFYVLPRISSWNIVSEMFSMDGIVSYIITASDCLILKS